MSEMSVWGRARGLRNVRRSQLSVMQPLRGFYKRPGKQLLRKRGNGTLPPPAMRGYHHHHHHHRGPSKSQPNTNMNHDISRYFTDEEVARSWRVDALQLAILDSSAIAAVSISASASAFVTPHVSISTSPPRENSQI
ncbi:hypothetical protein K443DRAFT_10175 [Laccaria amethystina LaAM-08-1]|uniref:Uncharacterized protein n=1 Tax=Laccaria amethystina LaAM-08-1 TaxID=1095629 RepID=A0A0C9WL94_9AGAR|nr:hypothetical protein K443DRAFT_10175 [Laccaria amethystina LaAM-08-1]